ncbi:MAG: hypothetical protein GY765_13895 [bacterium]|nr:hypothetical protein [bacterium]
MKLRKWLTTEHIILFTILLVGVFLRFKGLIFQGLWMDELISVTSSAPSASLAEILKHYQSDPHPPFFFLGLHYWMTIFGYTEFSARFFVGIIGTMSIGAVYLLGKETFNKTAGLIAACIISLNFFNLRYSQEVRPYILLFMMAALSFLFFLKLVKSQSRRNTILYALSTTILIYSHYYGLFILLSQLIFLLYYILCEKGIPLKSLLTHFSISGAIILLLYLPWIPTLLKMMKKKSHWIQAPPKSDFFITLFKRFWGSEPYLVVLFSGLLTVLLFYLLIQKKTTGAAASLPSSADTGTGKPVTGSACLSPAETVSLKLHLSLPLLFIWVFFSLFIPYYRSLVKVPMLYNHYAIGTLPALAVLVAISIALINNRICKAFIVTSIILMSFVNIFLHKNYYTRTTKAEWRKVVDLAAKEKKHKGNIYAVSNAPHLYSFYFHSKAPDMRVYFARKKNIRRILKQDPTPKEFYLLGGEQGEYSKSFLSYFKKHFTRVKHTRFHKVEAALWVHKSREPFALTDQYLDKVFRSPAYREYPVWQKNTSEIAKVSPSLITMNKKGAVSLQFLEQPVSADREITRRVIPAGTAAVSPGSTITGENAGFFLVARVDGQPPKKGWKINFGYEINKKGLSIPMPEGKYIHFIVKVNMSPSVANSGSFAFISDFKNKVWKSEKALLQSPLRRTLVVSKKIRTGSRRLLFGLRFMPKTVKDKIVIEYMRVAVSDSPLEL